MFCSSPPTPPPKSAQCLYRLMARGHALTSRARHSGLYSGPRRSPQPVQLIAAVTLPLSSQLARYIAEATGAKLGWATRQLGDTLCQSSTSWMLASHSAAKVVLLWVLKKRKGRKQSNEGGRLEA